MKPFRKLLGIKRAKPAKDAGFEALETPGLKRRVYDSYDEYLRHQGEKLGRRLSEIEKSDAAYEQIVRARLESLATETGDLRRARVLCLGARLGGEVRAFKSLGALAVGVDIEPGAKNPHVLYGDFHALAFPDGVFDIAFCNAVDHVFELEVFCREVARLLAPGGLFLVELAAVKPSHYEVLDTSDPEAVVGVMGAVFDTAWRRDMRNQTEFVDWPGWLIGFRKR